MATSYAARKLRYWFGHRQGHCQATTRGIGGVLLTCDRPEVHEGAHKDAGSGATWTQDPRARL